MQRRACVSDGVERRVAIVRGSGGGDQQRQYRRRRAVRAHTLGPRTPGYARVLSHGAAQLGVRRTCHLSKCKTTWKGNEGMMKCIDCSRFFCSGRPVNRESPQEHALWHAGENTHWVAQWCDEPNLGYCFLCARGMRLSDRSEDDYAVAARNKKDQQGLGDSVAKDGWGSVSGIAKDGCETGGKNPQNPENTQKYPHLDLPASKAPVLLSESPSTGEAEETSDCTYDIGSCEHLFKDREELDDMVLDIKTDEKLPECEHFLCTTTCTRRGAAARFMVCAECTSTFCTGEKGSMENPQGHARLHATRDYHWVALWYNEPYKGYCFECGHVLKLGQDKLSDDEWAALARNKRVERAMSASNGWDVWGTVPESYAKDLWAIVTGNDASGYANGNGCVIRGLPNLGNTCYMNALLQCLLALGELRTTILGPGARLGSIGLHLKQLFVETSSTNDARHALDPEMLLEGMRVFNPQFKGSYMQDSQECLTSLRTALEEETKDLNKFHGGAEFRPIGNSIFGGWLRQTLYCISCPTKSVLDLQFDELQLALPSKDCPARSVTLPPMTRSGGSPTKTRKELFQQTDKTDGEKIQTIAEGCDSQFPGSEFGDEAMEKIPKPLQVDSTEVEDVAHGRLQTQKNDVPREIIEVPIKALDFIANLFDDTEGMDESIVDPHSPEDTGPPPLVDIEAKENTYSVEPTTEDKGRAQSSDITDDEAVHMNSVASLEDCLTLLCYCPMGWKCGNCSKVVELGDNKIQTVAEGSTFRIPGSGLGDGAMEKTPRPLQVDSSEVKDVVHGHMQTQKNDVPQEIIEVLSAQDSPDTSTQNQGCAKQAMLDDHIAQQMEENQNEQKDGQNTEGSNGQMEQTQIFVETVLGVTMSLQFELSKSSQEFAEAVKMSTVFNQTEHYLEYGGTILHSKTKLNETGIGKGSTVRIRTRVLGGIPDQQTLVLAQFPFEDGILRMIQMPDSADTEPELTPMGSTIFRNLIKLVTDSLDGGFYWTENLTFHDFSVDEKGRVYALRPPVPISDVLVPLEADHGRHYMHIQSCFKANLDDLGEHIELYFRLHGKYPAYMQNLVRKLKQFRLVAGQLEPSCKLALLTHFGGLPYMCRINIVFQLKIILDSLGWEGRLAFFRAIERCNINSEWQINVQANWVTHITYAKGSYAGDKPSAFFVSRNYFSHSYGNAWINGYCYYPCDSGLEILLFKCLGDFLAELIEELLEMGFDLFDMLMSCCPKLDS
ncbi:hypothetical protein ACQJBY_064265 [Aegilops geniculata]